LVLAWLGDLRGGSTALALPLFLGLALLYLGALVLRGRVGRLPLWFWLGFALAFRLALLPTTPSLSDDIYRYIWEGRVQLAGHNPYLEAPGSPALEGLRDAAWQGVNHKELPAIYPPVMQLIFLGVAFLGGGIVSMKTVFVLADLGIALLIAKMLAARGREPSLAIIYAWHPLVILEVAGQGHFESIPAGLLLLAIHLLVDRPKGASLALAGSIGAKYLPIAFLPLFIQRSRLRDQLVGPFCLGLLFLPYLAPGFFSALGSYGSRWRFNDSGFWLIDGFLKGSGLSLWVAKLLAGRVIDIGGGDPALDQPLLLLPAKLVVAAILGGLVLLGLWRRLEPSRAVLLFLLGFVLLSPVVHPWYLLWLLPLLPLHPNAGVLCLSLLVPLSYEILLRYDGTGPSWQENPWIKLSIYGSAALAALLATLIQGLRAPRKPAPGEPKSLPAS